MSGQNSDEEGNQNAQSNDSSDEVSAASNRIHALMLSSPRGSIDSTHSSSISTATTSLPSTTSSSSVENVSGGSNTIDSRIESIANTDESRVPSISNTPLDERNPIQDMERRVSGEFKVPADPRPEPEGASEPELSLLGSARLASVSIDDSNKDLPDPVANQSSSKIEPKEPEVNPESPSEIPQLFVSDDHLYSPRSPVENVEQSKAGSSGISQMFVSDDHLHSAPRSSEENVEQSKASSSGIPQIVSDDHLHSASRSPEENVEQSNANSSGIPQIVSDDHLYSAPLSPEENVEQSKASSSGIPQIVSDDHLYSAPLSPSENVQQSTASSSDKLDYDESYISQSEYSGDTDHEADVSNISSMPTEKKKKVRRGKKTQPKPEPKLADILADYFVNNPFGSSVDLASRADTLDDADALRADSVSVRSSIPDLGAAVLFPDEVNIPHIPDRSRRAISLPAEPIKKGTMMPHDPRRAISESPDESKLLSEMPSLSPSPDDPLPSNLVSTSSSSSGHRVSDLNTCKTKKSGQTESRELETAVSRTLRQGDDTSILESDPSGLESSEKSPRLQGLSQDEEPDHGMTARGQAAGGTDASFTESGDVVQLQALQGWMDQGRDQCCKQMPKLPRPSAVPMDSSFSESRDAADLQALQGWMNQGKDQGEKQEMPRLLRPAAVPTDSSFTESRDAADLQALQGWMNQGKDQGGKQEIPRLQRPAAVPMDSSFTESRDATDLKALQGWMDQGKDKVERWEIPRLPPRPAAIPSDSSFTESGDAANLQALQGWVNQGRDKGEKREGPPRVPTLPVAEKKKVVLSDSTSTKSSDEKDFAALKAWVRQGKGHGPLPVDQPSCSTAPDVDVSEKCEEINMEESELSSTAAEKPEDASTSGYQQIKDVGLQEDVKPGDSKSIKRKRRDKKQLTLSLDSKPDSLDSSDQPLKIESPDEVFSSKKYCSEFDRPVLAKRVSRSNSTGSVKDDFRHRRNFREWQEYVTKESLEKDDSEDEDEEYSTSKKPKEDKDEEDDSQNQD